MELHKSGDEDHFEFIIPYVLASLLAAEGLKPVYEVIRDNKEYWEQYNAL